MSKPIAEPGQFLVVGRRDDTNEVVISTFSDIPAKPRLSDVCKRVLREIGVRDPFTYEFVALIYAQQRGGARVVLDQTVLRRYVHSAMKGGRR